MNTVYADNNATTEIAPEVYEAMVPFFTRDFFNPSSTYDQAQSTAAVIQGARQEIADLLGGVNPKEILFTSCATESNNTAIFGVAHAVKDRKRIITSQVEHPAVLEVCKELERRGYEVVYLPVDSEGNLDMDAYVRSLDASTLLVSIMHANNETGVIFPIEKLARIAKETDPGILFHTDATQTAGKLPIDLMGAYQHVDLLSFSGHKLHAPKGVGALFVRKGTPMRPFLIGGHQEEGRRGGTENVPYIAGLAKALALSLENHAEEEKRIRGFRDRLEKTLVEKIPAVQVNGKGAPRLPNTLNISSHFVEGEGILYQLSAEGICASSGSACTSGSLEPSHVLRALKIPFTAVHGSIRFSFSRFTTEADIDRIIEIFPPIIANLRKLSPYWDNAKNEPRPGALDLEPAENSSAAR